MPIVEDALVPTRPITILVAPVNKSDAVLQRHTVASARAARAFAAVVNSIGKLLEVRTPSLQRPRVPQVFICKIDVTNSRVEDPVVHAETHAGEGTPELIARAACRMRTQRAC